ncbi:3'(2'),5'-bisphosphate nucleotidase CysQ [Duganella sp. FT92W]|uniref:3'(2'),5'-bisphosphate nucleotidase CysQ n=1 Tax=Pseudoduganella rivuli TaxID=2666085 RepID=A0A7X2LV72_9BURK|nr:3'(2'),5'-bisphosphate nucleotidase CysQ [Pseudoduganella rivuli]MRV73634.1 3'(2'),5'-bisphosphate nucleotidase CysQ [Pseudoduganella rivuli]
MNVTTELLDTLCAIAGEAGHAIMEVYEGDIAVIDKADQSPLTVADMRADAIIRARLEAAFPGIYILSEESRSPEQAGADHAPFFLVDPLDGTKEFVKRNGEFTVNIALIADGVPVAGVVYAPALSTLYYGGAGLGAWCRDAGGLRPLQAVRWDPSTPLQVIGSRSHGAEELNAWLQKLPCAHEFVAAGSSLKFCRIAEGAAHAYPRFGLTSQWDTAAAHCVLNNAGGAVLALDGQPLRYGMGLPILNSHFLACHAADANWLLNLP